MAQPARIDDRERFGTPIARVMSTRARIIKAETSVADAAASMGASGVGCVIVSDEASGDVRGIFTERDLLVRVVGAGLDPRQTRVGEVMTRDVIVMEADAPFSAASDIVNQHGFQYLPVVSAGKLVGIVLMRDVFRMRLRWIEAQLDEELRALRTTQELIAMDEEPRVRALLSINQRLQEFALTDELTGLYNHRYFLSRLSEEVARSSRVMAPLSLLFGDIDHFKRVNDTHGHQNGDVVLQYVAQSLRDSVEGSSALLRLRKSDVVARYGGEEFAILLPGARAHGAEVVAERMRSAIASSSIVLPKGAEVRLTMSIGVASLPESASDGNDLVRAADHALYQAKDAGRNRVAVAPPVSSHETA
jgi:diguanylate cyclase (GGDEF)-like protein